MIVFLGLPSDRTMMHTVAAATVRKEPHMFFDLHTFLIQGTYYWDFSRNEGFIDNGSARLEFPNQHITGMYARPINVVDQLSEQERPEAYAKMNDLMNILNVMPILTVNHPRFDYSNSTKMYHLELLRQCGFQIPLSLLTNDEEEAIQFINQHNRVIFKGASSEKTIVSLYDPSLKDRLRWLINSPVLFQKYIQGADVRVHMVGSRFFCEKIDSKGIDYRYEKETNRFSTWEIPPSIQKKCFRYQQLSGLHFIGFDFKLTADGDYVIMEANPMPGYNHYDFRANLAISNALLELLSGKDSPTPDLIKQG